PASAPAWRIAFNLSASVRTAAERTHASSAWSRIVRLSSISDTVSFGRWRRGAARARDRYPKQMLPVRGSGDAEEGGETHSHLRPSFRVADCLSVAAPPTGRQDRRPHPPLASGGRAPQRDQAARLQVVPGFG